MSCSLPPAIGGVCALGNKWQAAAIVPGLPCAVALSGKPAGALAGLKLSVCAN